MAFVIAELDLLNLKIEYPEQFRKPTQSSFKSDLYIIPKSRGLGIIGLAEIVIGLHLSGEIKGSDGKPLPLISLSRTFEMMFNVDFGSIYDQQEKIFTRKPFNRTKTLDFLRFLLIRKGKDEK